ncbi:hypothetical protein F2Q70_00021181 [Brassica cretica]|uniref:Uncharacterized protein n=1 Tax=Brassica cretica TaxID=69181 RepID=A0A8S9KTH5_BRACR|nr:hypothetical protein F2Q70_00021181 [Brassica cretica]KAF2598314.1 hypothetical protein F2Q68_00008304 [Brassica cretica]
MTKPSPNPGTHGAQKKQRNIPPAWKRRLRTTTVPSKLTLDDNPEDSGDSRTKRKATDPAC